MGDSPNEHEDLDFLSDLLFSEETLESILQSLVAMTVRETLSADGATITLADDGGYRTSVSTSSVHRFVDVIQYEQDEGPCLSAIKSGGIVIGNFLADDCPWPAFAERAVAQGVYHSVCVPLSAHDRQLGSLNVYSNDKEASFDDEVARTVEMLGAWAGNMIRNFELYALRGDLVHQLYEALESRATIDIAKGMLMERHHVDAVDAFDRLRTESQSRNIKLRDVAKETIAPKA